MNVLFYYTGCRGKNPKFDGDANFDRRKQKQGIK